MRDLPTAVLDAIQATPSGEAITAALARDPFRRRAAAATLARARLCDLAGLERLAFSPALPLPFPALRGLQARLPDGATLPPTLPGWRMRLQMSYRLPSSCRIPFTSDLLAAAGIHLICGGGSGARPDRGDLAYHGAWDAVLLAADFPCLPLPAGSAHQALAMRRPDGIFAP